MVDTLNNNNGIGLLWHVCQVCVVVSRAFKAEWFESCNAGTSLEWAGASCDFKYRRRLFINYHNNDLHVTLSWTSAMRQLKDIEWFSPEQSLYKDLKNVQLIETLAVAAMARGCMETNKYNKHTTARRWNNDVPSVGSMLC